MVLRIVYDVVYVLRVCVFGVWVFVLLVFSSFVGWCFLAFGLFARCLVFGVLCVGFVVVVVWICVVLWISVYFGLFVWYCVFCCWFVGVVGFDLYLWLVSLGAGICE